jgi:hypothetical protein
MPYPQDIPGTEFAELVAYPRHGPLAAVSDFEAASAAASRVGHSYDALRLDTFEVDRGIFYPVETSVTAPLARVAVKGSDVVVTRDDTEPTRTQALYVGLWPDSDGMEVYEVTDVTGTIRTVRLSVDAHAAAMLDEDTTHIREESAACWSRRPEMDEYAGSRHFILRFGPDTSVMWNFMGRPSYLEDGQEVARITLGGTMLARPLPRGYIKIEDGRVLESTNDSSEIEIPAPAGHADVVVPSDIERLEPIEHGRDIQAYYPLSEGPDRYPLHNLAPFFPGAHAQIVQQVRWEDITDDFARRYQLHWERLASPFDKSHFMEVLRRVVEQARADREALPRPLAVGPREVMGFLAARFGRSFLMD